MQELQELWVQSPSNEDRLEKGMAMHSSVLAWRIQGTEEPGSLQSTESQRVGHDLVTEEEVKQSEVAQSCLTLCDPMDCSPPGSSIHGIFQARVLEWGAISFSRGSSWPRDRTLVSRIVGSRFYHWGKPSDWIVIHHSKKLHLANVSTFTFPKLNFLWVFSVLILDHWNGKNGITLFFCVYLAI